MIVMLVDRKLKIHHIYVTTVTSGSIEVALLPQPQFRCLIFTITLCNSSLPFQICIAVLINFVESARNQLAKITGLIIVRTAHFLCMSDVLNPRIPRK